MADTSSSGYWLNTDGYKNLSKDQQNSIQNEMVAANKNRANGIYNGASPTEIAGKYGLYQPPTVDQKIGSINDYRQDNYRKAVEGWYDNPDNRKNSTSDELYAADLFKQTGDTTFYRPYESGQSSPYDDLQKFFGLPSNLGNNKAYDVWRNQSDAFKANTIAGQAMGYMPQGWNQGGSIGAGGGGGGAGGKQKGEFDEFLKLFMLMMMAGQGGGYGQGGQAQFTPMQYGDGVHLYNNEMPKYDNTSIKVSNARDDALDKLLKSLDWGGKDE